jgi:hypothetical protein
MSDVVFDRMLFDHLDKVTDQTSRIAALEEEIARLRLTDEERAAVESCIADDEAATAYARADVLRELLKRLGSDRHIGG